MDGFAVADHAVARPAIEIDETTRGRLIRVMAAVTAGLTPEEITAMLQNEFSHDIENDLAIPLVTEEMSDLVDVFLAAMQSAEVTTG